MALTKTEKKELKGKIAQILAGAVEEKERTPEEQAAHDKWMLPYNVIDDIEERVLGGKIKIDFRGHFKSYREGWFQDTLSVMLMTARNDERSIEILTNRYLGKKDNRAVYLTHYRLACDSCGEEIRFKITKNKITAEKECPHPDGYPAYSVRLNVPSGKLIFGNDFRDLIDTPTSYDINRTRGCENASRAYADAGMIHIFVGNTCPGIYKVSDRRLNLVSAAYSYETDLGAEEEGSGLKSPKGEHVGGICTDLWWYSAMDYERFKKEAKRVYGKEWKGRTKGCDIVKVEPGCYKATGQYHRVAWNYETDSTFKPEEMFSYIKRDGDCRKLRPQSGWKKAAEFLLDVETAIEIRRMAWPTLTHDRLSAICDWFLHSRGWYKGAVISISEREEDAVKRYIAGERPDWSYDRRADIHYFARKDAEREGKEFVEPHRSFYPFSEYANCRNLPDNIRPDWLAACRDLLSTIIDNGLPPEGENEHEKQEYKRAQRTIKDAKECLKAINKRFGKEST